MRLGTQVMAWTDRPMNPQTSGLVSILITLILTTGCSAAAVASANLPLSENPDPLESEAAIFWFGRVTPTENSIDVRVGYNDDHLFVRVAVVDRLLWYDTSPSPDSLTDWDSVTLYLDLDGNLSSALDESSYYFDAQLVWWESRDDYQDSYTGDGNSWVADAVPFTTTSTWRSITGAPNDGLDDRAWALTYYIPFNSLGMSGPPAPGTVWGMAVAQHDRDDANGSPIADQVWSETVNPMQPSSWGQLAFGTPTFAPQQALPEGTTTVRHGLNGAIVVDAHVGGSSVCGGQAAPDYIPTWGELNYAGMTFANIQNLGDIGDWPCFSRYYVTFPIDVIPAGKVIISATLTLVQRGNAGEGQNPQPSLIQVHTVDQAWNESTITWNNSPLALENIAATWADVSPELPGEPRTWDVSRAVAQAYEVGIPVRLSLYESDSAYHSGKYFRSSDTETYYQELRPTLTITWGRALAHLEKTVSPPRGDQGDAVTYSLAFLGMGNLLILTDTLPLELSAPSALDFQGTSVSPTYDGDHHHVTWSDAPLLGQEVLIHYTSTITTADKISVVNTARLCEIDRETSTDTAIVIANPTLAYLPLIFRSK